ncbi:PP2C family protein-serine/threonine phosphatase [Kushneria marisflavi]|uniref:Serine/threonine protein phosphatase n=1 Tax=Kushneria marisflavi TaxID=157779 RepID=A0A240URM2_9GAMM|nr:SpoIIE family protein phosphatase [Kushneria marisflavi]ART64141.1 serine/threonine protein phosphatase [Kushneria marisflavi]RKD85889.1 serine phosphatase RsbU (regulator of sigma subunit) [Kushneria marisflavi]
MPVNTARIALVDQPGERRDALYRALSACGRFTLVAFDSLEALPEGLEGLIVHADIVPASRWTSLANWLPTVVVSQTRDSQALLAAVQAGMIDYLIDPVDQVSLLTQLMLRALDCRRVHASALRDRDRLEQLNEQLQTHLSTLRTDLQAGGQIQRRLQPMPCARLNGIEGDYWMAPSLYLSGDFLDYQAHGDRYVLFCFADVAGHGASSAFVTVLLKALFQRWLSRWNARLPENLPARWLARLNRELLDTGIGKHAAIVVGVIDCQTRTLHYSLGAQMPMPILATKDGVRQLEGQGAAVGLFPDVEYPTYHCELPEQFRLWLCSDGVFDCLPGNNIEERLSALCEHIGNAGSISDLKSSLALSDALPDDITFLTLSGFNDG